MKAKAKRFQTTILGFLALTTFMSAFATGANRDYGDAVAFEIGADATQMAESDTTEDIIDEKGEFLTNKVLIKYKFSGARLFQSRPMLPKRSGVVSLKPIKFDQDQKHFFGKNMTFNETAYYEAEIVKGLSIETAVAQLNEYSSVEYAEPIYVRKVDADLPNVLRATTSSLEAEQYYLNMINLEPARIFLNEQGINPGGARDIIVAVIDTGVDYNHEDLAANMWVNPGEIAGNGVDDDHNGWIDDIHGINTIVGPYSSQGGNPMDDHGHGTHVAGIIAADGTNDIGIRGIADNVRIMAIKAGQQTGVLLSSDIVEAINYARLMGADVINMSFGGYAASQIEREALELAFNGAVLVAAAGNDAKTTKPHLQGQNMYPAAYPWVLGVMATDATNTLASFSNYDYKPRDAQEYEVAVPGSQIISTLPEGRYAKWSGTSMSTPIVSAQAALLKSFFNDPMSHSSRFIMGQIIGTGQANVNIPKRLIDLGFTLYSSFNGIDISNSLKSAPKPELSVFDTFIWDPVDLNPEYNNANGVLDNGETVQLAIEIRNHWGKADDVNVTIDTKNANGYDNPYVTILTDTVNYGAVGTFNHDDNGFIYDDNKEIIGINYPFVIQVAPDAPNDYFVNFNVTMTAYNGLDPIDTGMYTFMGLFTYTIRNGTIVPNIISSDMVLSNDRYWIIPNSTIIMENVTVTVEPGTQIQFWSNDPDDPYALNAITYLRVDGKFITNGTAENPVKIFPSDLLGSHKVEIYRNGNIGNSYVELKYTEIVNPVITANIIDYCKFTQNYDQMNYRELNSEGKVNSYPYATPEIRASYISNSIFKGLGNLYIRSAFYVWGNLYNNLFDSNYMNFTFDLSATATGNVFLNNYTINQYGEIVTSRFNVYPQVYWNGSGYMYYPPYTPTSNSLNYNSVTGTTYFVLEAFSWQKHEVAAFSESIGGYLAAIESQDEFNYLYQRYGGQELVIGLEKASDGTIQWSNGEALYYVNPNTSIIDPLTRTLLAEDPTVYQSYVMKNGRWEITNDANVKRQYLIEIPGEIYVTDINFETNSITLGNSGLPFALDVMLTPYTANPADLVWTSSDETVVAISEDKKIMPLTEGVATVTVSSADGVVVKTITVNVITIVPLESLDLSVSRTQLNVGETVKGTLTFTPTDTTEKSVFWTSSDPTVASVDAYGNIVAKKPGTTTITVTNFEGTLTDSITLTVVQPVGSVNIIETNYLVPLSAEATDIAVTVGPDSATNKTLIWETSNPEVAYVNQDGKLVTVGLGTAILRATAQYTNIYDEVIISVVELTDTMMKFVQVENGYYSNQHYIFGLTDEGNLWVWGGEFLIPTKSTLTGIKQISICGEYDYSILLTTSGNVKTLDAGSLISSARPNSTITMENFPSIPNLNNIQYVYNHYYSCFAVDSSGNGWAWGYNDSGSLGVGVTNNNYISSPLQILGVSNIKQISGRWGYKYFLTTDGKIFQSNNTTDGTILRVSSGATKFIEYCSDGYYYMSDDGYIRQSNNGSIYSSMPVNATSTISPYYPYYTTTFGQLLGGNLTGAEFPEYFFTEVLYLESNNYVALTREGKVFMWGANNSRQLANLSITDSGVPLEIQFGIKVFDVDVQIEIQNINQGDVGVEIDTAIVLDFNTAIKASTQFAYIQLRDSSDSLVAMTRELRLDKLVLTPNSLLKLNERYTVSIPSNALQDIFGNQFAGTSFQFVTAETLGGSTEVIPVTSITVNALTTVVNAGESIKLTVDLLPLDTTQKSVRWTSSDRTIATVDMYGNVYGKRAGTVTITASNADWTVLGTIEITVNQPVTSVAFDDTMVLKSLGNEPAPIPIQVLPLDASNPALTWETSNPEIAYVDETGNLIVLARGTAIIRATAVDGGKYDDIIVSVSEEELEQVSIKEIAQFYNGGKLYTLALMQDGTLWIWGGSILVPTKTTYTGIKDIPPYVSSSYMLVLLNSGAIHKIYYSYIVSSILYPSNTQYWQENVFTTSNQILGLNDVRSISQTSYQTYFAIRSNGDVWGWGVNDSYQLGDGTNVNRSVPQKINGLTNIVKISHGGERTYFLSSGGDLFFTGYSSDFPTATKLDTGVTFIADYLYDFHYQKGDSIYYKSPEMSTASQRTTVAGGSKAFYAYINSGSAYSILSPDGSWSWNGSNLMPGITFSSIGMVSSNNIFAISTTGDLYMFGNNASGQLANFTTTPSSVPCKINFGIVINEGGLLLDSQSINNLDIGVNIDPTFIFDFNTAIKAGSNLPAIQLKDSQGNYVSVSSSIKLDKLYLTVDGLLIYGETYTLILPTQLVVDYFNNVYNGQTIQFTVETEPSGTLGFADNGRFYWSLADIAAELEAFNAEGGMLGESSPFGLNAILNNIQDPRSDNWMKIVGGSTSSLATVSLNYNYWGTESLKLIEAQFIDFDDQQALVNIDASRFLTKADVEQLEMIYPFVLDFYFSTEAEARTDVINISGGEMHVHYNVDMDTSVLPNVYFGPDIPYTDYKIEGAWITPRHWAGMVRVTLLTGDGYQYMRIRDAVAATNKWLVSGDDEKRLQFEIITSGTESLTLQATSAEGRVILSWMQDEFTPELMAGYNMYRASAVDGTYSRINDTVITEPFYEDFGAAPGVVYYYKFTVVQTDFTESDFSNIAAGAAFDTILPVLLHNNFSTMKAGQDNAIVAYATDNIGIQSIVFAYRLSGATDYTVVDMIRDGTTSKYTYLLKSSLITTASFEYYIMATDGLSSAYSGTPASPHTVTVLDLPTITTITPNRGPVAGGTTVTITGANFKEGVKVYFAELEGLNLNLVDSNRLTVVTPLYYASQVNVRVVNPFGSEAIKTNGFTYESDTVNIAIPTVTANIGSEVAIPVRLTNVNGLLALDLTVTYDSSVLTYTDFLKGSMGARFSVIVNKNTAGTLIIAMAADLSIAGTGDILYLKFRVVNTVFADSAINITRAELNGGNIPVTMTNGTLHYEPVLNFGTTVYYFSNNALVENVTIILSNTEYEHIGVTDATGKFTFTAINKGDYNFDVDKSGDASAISAYDAALVLQNAVGIIALNSNQQLVADVNADGKINSLDASYILQYVAGFTVLPFAGRESAWYFTAPTTFTNLTANTNVTVTAYLIGDVSGNYGTTSVQAIGHDGAYRVGAIVKDGNTLYVPVDLMLNAEGIYALSFKLTFDSSLRVKAITYHPSLENALKVANTNVAGQISVAIAGVDAISSMAGLIRVELETTETREQFMFAITASMINESTNLINAGNGYATIATTDFNSDGAIDHQDLVALVQWINRTYAEDDIAPFDFNSDGIVDIYDVIAMIKDQRARIS